MAEYRLLYSPQAKLDMEAVWADVYEVSKSLDVANGYVDDFLDKIALKKQFLFSGIPLTYRGLFTGYYSVNFKKYKTFYRVNDYNIEVIRIIMMKKDYMGLLFGDDK